MGRSAWIREQTQPDGTEHPFLIGELAQVTSENVDDLKYYADYRNNSRVAIRELVQSTVLRAAFSKWQVRERMVDFWHDHLNIGSEESAVTRAGHRIYDRDVIRAHVFGSFTDMLIASAKSASMLEYLNGAQNQKGGPNENYAREVMELHTLGEDGPFDETDIRELAKCFTGWSYRGFGNDTIPGEFRFRGSRHEGGTKTVLGQSFGPEGVREGEDALRMLASHPKTADFISRKLVRRFVSESAPEAAIEVVRSRWLATDGDLRAVTRALLSDRLARLAEPWSHPKVKRPFEYFTGIVRSLGVLPRRQFRDVDEILSRLGQLPFAWPAPNGYPDSSAAWSAGLFSRWVLARDVLSAQSRAATFDNATVNALRALSAPETIAATMSRELTGSRLDPSEVAMVQAWYDARPNPNRADFREMLSLLLSLPSYQLA